MHLTFSTVVQLAFLLLPVLASTVQPNNPTTSSGRHIVMLKAGVSVVDHINNLTLDESSKISHTFTIINAFAGNFTHSELGKFRADSNVQFVEDDLIASTMGAEFDNPWGLNRISTGSKLQNQDPTQLSFTYTYTGLGSGVDIYMVDTGILTTHPAFEGRASWGATFGGYPSVDDNGHGTHTAGTAISNPYGVAQQAQAIAVKVVDASGSGLVSDIVAGLQWVGNQAPTTGRPSLVSMSLGLASGYSQAWDSAVAQLISSNIPVVIAAGNSNQDASLSSPSDVVGAIVVGASDITDTMASFSNYGSNVAVFAPGVGVISTYNDGSTASLDGTSMATPHVAGQVAVLLSTTPGGVTPSVALQYVESTALQNQLQGIPSSTANLLLNNGNVV